MIDSYNEIVKRIILNDKNKGYKEINPFVSEGYSSVAGWKEFTDKAKCKVFAEKINIPRGRKGRRDATKTFYLMYKDAVPAMERLTKKMEDEINDVSKLPLPVRDPRVDKWRAELYDARKRINKAKTDLANLKIKYNQANSWDKKKFTDQWFNGSQRAFRNLCEDMLVINQEKKKVLDERLWSDIKKGLLAPARGLVLLLIKFNVLGLGTIFGKLVSLSSGVKKGLGRIWERFGGKADDLFKTISKGKNKKILFNKGMENQSSFVGMIDEIKHSSDAGDVADKILKVLPVATTAFDCATNGCKETPYVKTATAIIKPMLYVVKLGDSLGEKLEVVNEGLDKAQASAKNYTPPPQAKPQAQTNNNNQNYSGEKNIIDDKKFDIKRYLKIAIPITLVTGSGIGMYYLFKN